MSGSGKSYTARGRVEALLLAQRHVAVVDPTASWWGVRARPDGSPGWFDIAIFGGPRGDLPITASDGDKVARIVAETRVSAIVDLSGLHSGAAQRQFMLGFTSGLRGAISSNFHLVVDEADEFAAQSLQDGEAHELREEMRWIFKRGRNSGFIADIITQRPADIDKGILSQAEVLVVHQLTHKTDRDAVKGWLAAHVDKAQLDEVIAGVAKLGVGERWICGPRDSVFALGWSPALTTYDSGRAPAAGEEKRPAATLASLDLATIRAAWETSSSVSLPVGEIGKWQDAEVTRLRSELELLRADHAFQRDLAATRGELIKRARAALIANGSEVTSAFPPANEGEKTDTLASSRQETSAVGPVVANSARCAAKPMKVKATAATAARASSQVNSTARLILDVLVAVAPAALTWTQATTLAGRKTGNGNWYQAKNALLASGRIIERGDTIAAAAVEGIDGWPQGRDFNDVIAMWQRVLPNPAGKMIGVLLTIDQARVTRAEMAAALGLASHTNGHFYGGIKHLKDACVVVENKDGIALASPLPGEIA